MRRVCVSVTIDGDNVFERSFARLDAASDKADTLMLVHDAAVSKTARLALESCLDYWAVSERERVAPPSGDLGDMHVLESANQVRVAEAPLLSHKQHGHLEA